ncbi:hypothetical protein [Mycolicibacterium goodii]|uniref:hypothetical protein n=1 Tax=Mycolicibacterium goodii TaxID=134601 RepID=UPI001BDDC4F2|nr:hypothetical protein [Mycolicibacterium goodii]MBU8834149.1 hypothetical protein [Mycolicibacterium goodii]
MLRTTIEQRSKKTVLRVLAAMAAGGVLAAVGTGPATIDTGPQVAPTSSAVTR